MTLKIEIFLMVTMVVDISVWFQPFYVREIKVSDFGFSMPNKTLAVVDS